MDAHQPYFIHSGRLDDDGRIRVEQSSLSNMNVATEEDVSELSTFPSTQASAPKLTPQQVDYTIRYEGDDAVRYVYPDPGNNNEGTLSGYGATSPKAIGLLDNLFDEVMWPSWAGTSKEGPDTTINVPPFPPVGTQSQAIPQHQSHPAAQSSDLYTMPLLNHYHASPQLAEYPVALQPALPFAMPNPVAPAPYDPLLVAIPRNIAPAPFQPLPVNPPTPALTQSSLRSPSPPLPLSPRVFEPLPANLQVVVDAINELTRQNGHTQPRRAALKNPFKVLPNEAAVGIRKHFNGGTGLLRENSELRGWIGDERFFQASVWKFLAVARAREWLRKDHMGGDAKVEVEEK